nr:EOG090X04CK [Triops cancriformis]
MLEKEKSSASSHNAAHHSTSSYSFASPPSQPPSSHTFFNSLHQHSGTQGLARKILRSILLTIYFYVTSIEFRFFDGHPTDSRSDSPPHWLRYLEQLTESNSAFDSYQDLVICFEKGKIRAIEQLHMKVSILHSWSPNYNGFSAILVNIVDVAYYVLPKAKDEVNLSMFWCMLLLGFSVKLLFSIAGLYFKSTEAAAERSVVIVSGFAFFVLALGLLIISEENLELGLDKAYSKFNESASVFLEINSLDSEGPASKLMLKLVFAVYCGISGALLTFPGLRVSRMHSDALDYNAERPAVKMWLHLNFIMPFLVAMLWVKPIARHYFTVRIFTGMSEPLLTESAFDTIRIWFCVACCVMRLTALPVYLQAYLNLAERQLQAWKKEAGKTTNVELQKTVARVYYYLCVVALQYVAPICMCLAFTYIYKTMGGFTWLKAPSGVSGDGTSPQPVTLANMGVGETLTEARGQWELALMAFKQVFSTEVFRGVCGFFTWWSFFLCFSTSAFGVAYQKTDAAISKLNI